MKIQIDLPEEINKKLKIYKVKNNLKTIAESVVKILEEKWKKK